MSVIRTLNRFTPRTLHLGGQSPSTLRVSATEVRSARRPTRRVHGPVEHAPELAPRIWNSVIRARENDLSNARERKIELPGSPRSLKTQSQVRRSTDYLQTHALDKKLAFRTAAAGVEADRFGIVKVFLCL